MKLPIARAAAAGVLALLGTLTFAQAEPIYSADVPAKITTPDSVDTRIGTLSFKHGIPDDKTVKTVYDMSLQARSGGVWQSRRIDSVNGHRLLS